jgi:hypothetical protein
MSDLEMKSFGPFEIKSEDRGEVVAVVATLGVVDKDGDVILPGAVPLGGARVKLSGYDHDSVLKNLPPAGKGVIAEEGDHLVFRGKFFMTTERGREAFHTVKELGDEGEWSFGFPRATKNATLTDEWRTKGAKRLIAGMRPIEASPVFVGAGWGTQTLYTKAAEIEAEPQADGDPGEIETPAEVEARILYGDPTAPEPLGVITASGEPLAEPVESEEAKAARELEAALKAKWDEMIEEYQRVQQAQRRMGYAA